jgi:segregation and condensation protein B
MSLKAKIEAVIYASEEPVTLAQLVGLLGVEAQAELDRTVAQQTLALEETEREAADTDPALLAELEAAGESTADGEADVSGVAEAEGVLPTNDGEAVAIEEAPAVEAMQAEIAPELAETGEAEGVAAAKAEKARMARLRGHFRAVLDELVKDYATPERGLEIREVGGGFRLATKPEYHDAVRGFVKSLKPPLKLTLQALETLAVVAYKQPVTAPEISEIRGVDSSGVLGSLIARKLITTAGRKQVIGRPILYKTTKEFLLKFGLKDVAELPSIEEFEKMAGQMAEQEEMAMEHETPESPKEIEERLESDQEAQSPEPVADEAIVDGRISGLAPRFDEAEDDPSAVEAEIQSGGEE